MVLLVGEVFEEPLVFVLQHDGARRVRHDPALVVYEGLIVVVEVYGYVDEVVVLVEAVRPLRGPLRVLLSLLLLVR